MSPLSVQINIKYKVCTHCNALKSKNESPDQQRSVARLNDSMSTINNSIVVKCFCEGIP